MFSVSVIVLVFTTLSEFRIHKPMDIGLLDALLFYLKWVPRHVSPEGIVRIFLLIAYLFSLERVYKSNRASKVCSSRSWTMFLLIDTLILRLCPEKDIREMRESEIGCITKTVIFCVLFLYFYQILKFLVAKTVPNLFITVSPEPSKGRHTDYTQQINIGKTKSGVTVL